MRRKTKRARVNKIETLEPRLVLDSTVVFNEIMFNPTGTDESLEWVEFYNQMSIDMDISEWTVDGLGFTFPDGTRIAAGENLLLAKSPVAFNAATGLDALGPYTGSLSNSGERLELRNNSRRVMNVLDYRDSGDWPVGPDGSGSTLAKIDPGTASDDPSNWTTSAQTGGTPGARNFAGDGPITGPTTTLLAGDAVWRFDDTNTDLGTAWREPGFNDSAWGSGAALLGFEDAALESPLATGLNPGASTYYFRREFNFSGTPGATDLKLETTIDDGAVFYLNGTEILRLNMPGGPVSHDTLAASTVFTAKSLGPITLPTAALVDGVNVLAVEVHAIETELVLPAPSPQADSQPSGAPAAGEIGVVASFLHPEAGYTLTWDGNQADNFDQNAPPAGSVVPDNLALASNGATPFTSSDLGPELGIPFHVVTNLNDGIYGNSNSWIGGGTNPFPVAFAGISFGTQVDIGSIAWGRDNGNNVTDACGGQCTDRWQGVYTIQRTLVASPGAATLDTGNAASGWETIGTADYNLGAAGFTGYLRHEYDVSLSGAAVPATAIRIIVPGTGLGGGTAIDEIEVFGSEANLPLRIAAESGYEISWDGNDGDNFDLSSPAIAPSNLVQTTAGLAVFASGEAAAGTIGNVADGEYGDASSWTPDATAPAFIAFDFGGPLRFDQIAFGRDNGNDSDPSCAAGQCTDGALGTYTLQITNVAVPQAATETGDSQNGWETIGELTYNLADDTFTPYLRHQFQLTEGGLSLEATGLRIVLSDQAITFDEIELYREIGDPPLEIEQSAGFTIAWDGNDGDNFSSSDPAVVPQNLVLTRVALQAFASSEAIPGGVTNIADGEYGDAASWRSAGTAPVEYIGLNFGGNSMTFDRIAFGRDNGNNTDPDCPAGQCTTDATGTYTLQITRSGDPGTNTDETENAETGWQTVGTLQYNLADSTFTPYLRHEYNVLEGGQAIVATGLRILVSDPNMTIDEIELSLTPVPVGLNIDSENGFAINWDGNDGDNFNPNDPATVPENLALASSGTTALGSGELGGIHSIANANDGLYGNSNSWISNGVAPAFVGVAFAGLIDIERIAWGRDNGNNVSDACGGQCTDRSLGTYTLQVTRAAAPDSATPETGNAATGWQTVGTLEYEFSSSVFTPYLRHEFSVSEGGDAVSATGVRIVVSNAGTAIDEIEVYGRDFFDVVFGAELTAAEILPDPAQLVINEVAGSLDAEFFVEITNLGDLPVALDNFILARDGVTIDQFVFPPTVLAAGEILSVDAATLGFSGADGDKIFLYSAGQTSVLDAQLVDDVTRGRSTENDGRWLRPGVATPGAENTFSFESDIVINEIFYHARADAGTPDIPSTFETTNLLSITADNWRYNESGVDLGVGWQSAPHTVGGGGWQQGPGPIGFETAVLQVPLATTLTNPSANNPFITTYYFEREFEFSGNLADVDQLRLTQMVDDGAVFYLNGVEVLRFNMPAGEVTAATFSNGVVSNAPLSNPVTIPADGLVVGTNRLSVEVHQRAVGSSDIVMGVALDVRRQLTQLIPGTPYQETPDEWIELYNRGDTAVDLSGWALRDGVRYDFAAGTTIAPGEYVVVANDPVALAAAQPGIRILAGAFTGSLSNSGERILLRDASRNPADKVTYYDGGRWSEYADGDGASLELIDPDADNDVAESWAASDESAKSEWATYSYRGVAQADTTPIRWNEFVVGLFGAGEILLDDLSVVREPDGVATSLLVNGDFEADNLGQGAADWRILGNHSQSVVIDDPDNPGANQVLRLFSTGQTSDRQNHLETTFIDNQIAPNGVEYEISFRAKWLAGARALNTRLYFNRLAARTLLVVPETSGTPGMPNSRLSDNIENNAGPTYAELKHGPVVPSQGESVTVSVVADDPDGIASMTLRYSVNGGGLANVSMVDQGNGLYTGTISAAVLSQASSPTVQFYVEGTDSLGAVTTFPAEGADSRALFKVQDNQAADGALQNFRIIMTAADTSRLHDVTNVMSNQRMGATIVVNESEVFYNVGVRLKGSMAARPNSAFLGYSIEFQPDQLFRGVHREVAIDRSGRGALVGNGQEEILVKHMMNSAGDIPSMQDDLINVIAPRSSENGSALLLMAAHGDLFLDSQYKDGSDGDLYNFDLIYYQRNTIGDPVTGLKTPVGYGHPANNIDIEDRGDNKENYRWHFRKKNNRDRDDFSRLIELAKAMSLPAGGNGSPLDLATREVMDVDQWMRAFAMTSLAGIGGDTYARGLNHNLRLYVRPEDQQVLAFPWDMDNSAFGLATNANLYPGANIGKIIAIPTNKHIFDGNLQDIINTTFSTEYMTDWVNYYSSVLPGQNFSAAINYISARSAFALGQFGAERSFAVTTADTTVATPSIQVSGNGWVNVREIFVAGRVDPLNVTWINDSDWTASVDLATGENLLSFEAFDFQGDPITNVTDVLLTVTSTATQPLVDNLRITELMYNPGDPTPAEQALGFTGASDFEFIELQNIGGSTINLAGTRFTDGIEFTFGDTDLAAGDRILVVRDSGAFEARYGTGLNIAGEYGNDLEDLGIRKLSNGGETVTLEDSVGTTIQSFVYDDNGIGWHPTTDGDGPSLVIIDAGGAVASWNEGSSWRASFENGGSPGSEDVNPGDINGDGRVSLLDVAALQSQSVVVDRSRVVDVLRRFGADLAPAPSPAAQAASIVAAVDSSVQEPATLRVTRQALRTSRLAVSLKSSPVTSLRSQRSNTESLVRDNAIDDLYGRRSLERSSARRTVVRHRLAARASEELGKLF